MSEPETQSESASPIQFRLSTIFVLTLVAGILAAFLSPRGHDLMLAGLVCIAACALVAAVVGYVQPPLANRVFWGVVIAAMMLAVASETTLLDRAGIYAWPLTAGLAAVVAAGPGGLYRRMLLAAVTAGIIIVAYVVALGAPSWTIIVAYVACAAIGAALMTILIDSVNWLEEKHRIAQPAIGLVLVLGALGFAVAAPRLIPGW